jgi:hypothetical protein
MYWLFAVWAITIATIWATINVSREDRWDLSTFAVAAEFFFALYLNRLEPKYVTLNDDDFEITYVNLVSYLNYKKAYCKEKRFSRNAIAALKKEGIIILKHNNRPVAKIRKKALEADDWEMLIYYFVGQTDLQLNDEQANNKI